MRNVTLGKTGLRVSEVGFGGIPIIPLGGEEAGEVVRHCFDAGITFFDTANAYRDSETKIGNALDGVRDRVVLATKTTGRDAETAASHLRKSLESLRTEWIDLYQLHNVSSAETLNQVLSKGGAYEVAEAARAEGKIRHIGVTSHNIPTAIDACRTGRFETVQFPFNFVERDPAEELFRVAQELGMGIIGMKPLGGGWLDQAKLAFGFLQEYPQVVPIPGMRSRDEVDEVVSLYHDRISLTASDRQEMERIRAELGSKFCHRCEYCMPCEQGIRIPMALGFPMFAKRFGPQATLKMFASVMETAESCTECGQCEEKCPYDLEIPRTVKENLAIYREYVRTNT